MRDAQKSASFPDSLYISEKFLKTYEKLKEPNVTIQKILVLVLIVNVSSESSDETAHLCKMCDLTRAFVAHAHKGGM